MIRRRDGGAYRRTAQATSRLEHGTARRETLAHTVPRYLRHLAGVGRSNSCDPGRMTCPENNGSANQESDSNPILVCESLVVVDNCGYVVKSAGYMHWHVCSKSKVSNCSPPFLILQRLDGCLFDNPLDLR